MNSDKGSPYLQADDASRMKRSSSYELLRNPVRYLITKNLLHYHGDRVRLPGTLDDTDEFNITLQRDGIVVNVHS